MHRFRLVHKNQLNNLNFKSYWLVDLKFRAPDWSKFKLFGRIYDWFGRNRNLCSTLVQTNLANTHCRNITQTDKKIAGAYKMHFWHLLGIIYPGTWKEDLLINIGAASKDTPPWWPSQLHFLVLHRSALQHAPRDLVFVIIAVFSTPKR